jgi:DNA-directed RNA polymerase subunit RPC12/RpoP
MAMCFCRLGSLNALGLAESLVERSTSSLFLRLCYHVPMPEEITLYHCLIAGLIVAHLLLSVRVALRMRTTGRNFWKWLVITAFCTGVPSGIVLSRDRRRRKQARVQGGGKDNRHLDTQGETFRCPHCNRPVAREDLDAAKGLAVCPHCGLPIDANTRIA